VAFETAPYNPAIIRSSLAVFISEEQTKENDENIGYLFLSGLQNFIIGRGNDEAIRLFSDVFGLLHSVTNDEIL
jgi:hypothetical protein